MYGYYKGLKVLVISFTLTVILFPLRPVCGMHPVGCKDQLIDLTMFL